MAAPLPEDNTMTLDEFGAAKEKDNTQKGSLSGLKRWLSKSSVHTKASKEHLVSNDPPQVTPPTAFTYPAPKRKREEEEDSDIEGMPDSFTASEATPPEQPVKRVIKSRPIRAVKQAITSPVAHPTSSTVAPASSIETSEVANKVWEEMNARLKQSGKASMVQLPSQDGWSVSSGLKPPASPLKSMNSRTKGRFSNEHEKHFGQMDSIASHYAARRERDHARGSAQANEDDIERNQKTTKRIRIEKPEGGMPLPEKSIEDRAAIQRKLEMARQRRKSVGRTATSGRKSGATTTSKVGFKSKISGAVRDFVGVARVMAAGGEAARSKVTHQKSFNRDVNPSPPLPVAAAAPSSSSSTIAQAPSQTLRHAKSRPTFDLQASLARKPSGYTPYSAKETVQLIQTAAIASGSPFKTALSVAASSPIRSGWTMIPAPVSRPAVRSTTTSTSSSIAFPCVSPLKDRRTEPTSAATSFTPTSPALNLTPSSHAVRRNTLQNVPAKKTRSSMSANKKGAMQGDRLKRAARVNEIKHQASMAAKRRTGDAVQRAVARGESLATKRQVLSGNGRGSPRKVSGRVIMEGEGRGAPGLK